MISCHEWLVRLLQAQAGVDDRAEDARQARYDREIAEVLLLTAVLCAGRIEGLTTAKTQPHYFLIADHLVTITWAEGAWELEVSVPQRLE
jgi:hypothetical protein